MSENLRKILDQFSSEGLDENWSVISAVAHLELRELEKAQKKLAVLENAGVDNRNKKD